MKRSHLVRIALICAGLWVLTCASSPPGLLPGGKKPRGMVLVQPFENRGSPQHAWLALGLADSLVHDLMAVRDLGVISSADRKRVMDEIAFSRSGLTARMKQLSRVLRVDALLQGSYRVQDGVLIIQAVLTPLGPGFERKQVTVSRPMTQVFAAQDAVLLGLLGKSIGSGERAEVLEPLTKNLAAFRMYASGLRHDSAGRGPAALKDFRAAVRLDPEFAGAYLKIGVLEYNAGRSAAAAAALKRGMQALAKTNRTRSVLHARFLQNQGIVWVGQNKLRKGQSQLRRSLELLQSLGRKNSVEYARGLATYAASLGELGHEAEGLRLLKAAEKRMRNLGQAGSYFHISILQNLGTLHQNHKQSREALRYFKQVRAHQEAAHLKTSSSYATTLTGIGAAYSTLGLPEQGLSYLRRALKLRGRLGQTRTRDYAAVINLMGGAYSSLGQNKRALAHFQKAIATLRAARLTQTFVYADATGELAHFYFTKLKQPCAAARWMAETERVTAHLRHASNADARSYLARLRRACKR